MIEFDPSVALNEQELEQGLKLMESVIGGRWNSLILFQLEQGRKSYTDIRNSIDYISDTELQRKLNTLIDSKLVKKGDGLDAKKREYALTPYGEDITHTLHHIMDISLKHRELG